MIPSLNLTLVLLVPVPVAGQTENTLAISGEGVALYERPGDDSYSPGQTKLLHPMIQTDREVGFVFPLAVLPGEA